MDAADDSDDSDNDARNSSEYDHWGCEKCGMKMSTLKELIGHRDTHKIFQCARCHLRFTSNYLADKHELSCQGSTDSDVFEASRTTDPLLVVMNSLGQLVDTFDKARAINKDVTGMMKDQLRKSLEPRFFMESTHPALLNIGGKVEQSVIEEKSGTSFTSGSSGRHFLLICIFSRL